MAECKTPPVWVFQSSMADETSHEVLLPTMRSESRLHAPAESRRRVSRFCGKCAILLHEGGPVGVGVGGSRSCDARSWALGPQQSTALQNVYAQGADTRRVQ